MKVKLDKGAYAPTQAHDTDAGYDLRVPCGYFGGTGFGYFMLGEQSSICIDTGVHIEIPHGYCGIVISKSGLNVNHDITSTGLVDEGYTGSIVVKLYNHGRGVKVIKEGDKISQIAIVPCLHEKIEIVDKLEPTERGANGFGSTGR